jgi:hypothetical protein
MTTASKAAECARRRCGRPVSIVARDGQAYCGHHADRPPTHACYIAAFRALPSPHPTCSRHLGRGEEIIHCP